MKEPSKEDVFLEELLKGELRAVNFHVPLARKTLAQLLLEEWPRVKCRDGSYHYFKRRELELLKSIVPEDLYDKLRLPIIITRAPELGEGAFIVEGDAEAQAVAKILGLDYDGSGRIVIYSKHVRKLRSLLPTATQYAFSSAYLVI